MADARATLVDLSDASAPNGLTVTMPRSQVEEALSMDEPVDLVLDLTRYTEDEGPGETGRVAVAWERDELEELLRRSDDDSITMVFDEDELRRMLDPEFEAHGMREAIAVLAVAVVAGGAASVASAQPAEYTGIGGAGVIEQVRSAATTQAPGADIEAARSAAALEASAPTGASGIEAVRSAEPMATAPETGALAASSSIEAIRAQEPLPATDVSADTAALASASSSIEAIRSEEPLPVTDVSADTSALASASGIEAVRSAEPLTAAADTGALASASGIEAIRSAEPLVTDTTLASASGGIEAVRSAEAAATRAPAPSDGGIALDMPSPETTAALLGGFALLITGAAFVARSKRHELRLP